MITKITIISKIFSKDLSHNLLYNIKKEYEQVSSRKKTKCCSKFVNLVYKAILVTIIFYRSTINSSFSQKEKKKLYANTK